VSFTLDPGHVAAFARALGADSAAGVPPTYAAVYALATTGPLLFDDPEAGIDFGRLVHAGQSFTWERHPEPGETVVARGRVLSDLERRGIRMIELETTCWAGEELICTSRSLFVVRP
jgi:N-terminal half of MaoC dehydratase